jgi:RNA polymerase sigma-70 factor, ECF subfamily
VNGSEFAPVDPDESTEMRLVRSWRSGDRASGDRLLRRYVPLLESYFARRMNRNVDELVQRTLFACVEAVERFEGRSTFKSYLLGIAHNQFLMSLRSDSPPSAEGPALSTPPDDNPSQLAAFREEQFNLLRALVKVDREYLVVLESFYWGQLSVEEIAAEQSIPVGTVKSRLSRGRALLKVNLMSMQLRPAARQDALRELAAFLNSRSNAG